MAKARIVFEDVVAEDLGNLIQDLDVGVLWLEHKVSKIKRIDDQSLSTHTYRMLEERLNRIKQSLLMLVAHPRY